MKKFLIAGSSLAAVAAAGSAGAVDVTLGGSIDMGVKYGVGKDTPSGMAIGANYQSISISVAAAGTTDAGMKFGGSFGISTADELVFNPYVKTAHSTTASGALVLGQRHHSSWLTAAQTSTFAALLTTYLAVQRSPRARWCP